MEFSDLPPRIKFGGESLYGLVGFYEGESGSRKYSAAVDHQGNDLFAVLELEFVGYLGRALEVDIALAISFFYAEFKLGRDIEIVVNRGHGEAALGLFQESVEGHEVVPEVNG